MGSTFIHGADRKYIIANLTKSEEGKRKDGTPWKYETLRKCAVGNVLWTVREVTEGEKKERFIGCDLLLPDKSGWGYKDMSESMHPYYYTCPLAYLDEVPVACEEWRALVREHHAKKTRKLEVGATYSLVGCKVKSVRLTSIRPLRGYGDDGRFYRVSKKLIGDKVESKAEVAVAV